MLSLLALPAFAEPPVEAVAAGADADAKAPFLLALKSGVTGFLQTQSKVPEHFLKPVVRLEVGYLVRPELIVGVELSAIADASEFYRVAGGYVVGRAAMVRGDVFSMWFGWGAGLGMGPRILAPDLLAQSDVTLWVQAGLLFRFEVIEDVLSLGLDLINEQATLLTGTGTVQLHF
jgi:hypothetical protein